MSAAPLDEVLAARLAAQRLEEEGTVATLLVHPALALTGGLIGGLTVAALAWRALWHVDRATVLELDRRYLRGRR